MEVLNTQRTEKMNRVKLVEKEKDELEGPMKEALAYVRVENELAQLKHSLHQVYNALQLLKSIETRPLRVTSLVSANE